MVVPVEAQESINEDALNTILDKHVSKSTLCFTRLAPRSSGRLLMISKLKGLNVHLLTICPAPFPSFDQLSAPPLPAPLPLSSTPTILPPPFHHYLPSL